MASSSSGTYEIEPILVFRHFLDLLLYSIFPILRLLGILVWRRFSFLLLAAGKGAHLLQAILVLPFWFIFIGISMKLAPLAPSCSNSLDDISQNSGTRAPLKISKMLPMPAFVSACRLALREKSPANMLAVPKFQPGSARHDKTAEL